MKRAYALALLGFTTLSQGCALLQDTSRNLCAVVTDCTEAHREKTRDRQWAEAAWQTVCMKDGPVAHSADFAMGFKDGFAEYLYRGGNGEPPLMAPQRYRRLRYQNPQGYQLIHDWFDGFRFGAASARDSGARKWITGPSSVEGQPVPTHDLPMPTPIESARKETSNARITGVRTAQVASSAQLPQPQRLADSVLQVSGLSGSTVARITAVRLAPLGN
jgi:hypothetical protein